MAQGNELQVSSGFTGLKLLKTTQSAFVKFLKDQYTTLPEVTDRLVATSVTAKWTYSHEKHPRDFQKQSQEIRNVLVNTFAGPADTGTPSPAVQFTLYQMGKAVLEQCPSVDSIFLSMPNIHNLPLNQTKFGLPNVHPHGEIFVPTDEPHGMIEATIRRGSKNSKL